MRRGSLWFLTTVAVIPALGISIVVLVPPPNHGYLVEQVLLLTLALVSLQILRVNLTSAIFLYCSLALLPIGSMLHHHHNTIDDWWALVYVIVPFFGLGFVTLLTKDDRAIQAYGIVVFLFSLAVGGIYNKPGLSGILCIFSALATGGALLVVNHSRMRAKQKLDELRGEARRMERKITQELAKHDP